MHLRRPRWQGCRRTTKTGWTSYRLPRRRVWCGSGPLTAVSTPSVSDLLQSYRQDARLHGALTFGMNLIALQGTDQVLKVGQAVKANYRFDRIA